MAVDISPEILEEIGKHFDGFYSDLRVKRIYKKIVDGTATHLDTQVLSRIVGEYIVRSVEKSYVNALESGKLPNNTLYENIVEKTLGPTLRDGHSIITEACGYVQQDLNRKAGIRLNPVEPALNESRITGLIHEVANKNEALISRTVVGGLIDTFSRSIVDDYVRANLDFQKESGLKPLISRTRGSNSNSKCEFCAGLVYTGEYKAPGMPAGIFKRHRYCHCNVIYNGIDGKYQDVWSKREYQDYREAQRGQRQYLAELDKMTPTERRLARNARARELGRAKYTPQEWQRRKALEKINAERDVSTGLSLEERKVYAGLRVEPQSYDVTSEYRKRATPKEGGFLVDPDYKVDLHDEELAFADWVYKMFGGELQCLNEKDIDGVLNPDYLWNGALWDLKSPTTSKHDTLDKRIRHGLEQIETNPGGLMLNFTNSSMSFDEASAMVISILNNKAHVTTDVIIKKGSTFGVFRVKK